MTRILATNAVASMGQRRALAEELDAQPFWRWRRRRRLKVTLAKARRSEKAAVEALGGRRSG